MISQQWKETYTFAAPEHKALALRIFDEVGERCGSVQIETLPGLVPMTFVVVQAPVKDLERWISTFPREWRPGLANQSTWGGFEFWNKATIELAGYLAARPAAN